VLYGLGTTIGAGIYALTGVVAGRAGMYAPVSFFVASLLALFTALSFGELSSRYPRAGGEAVYVLEGTGRRRLATAVGLLTVVAGIVSSATIAVAFAGYFRDVLDVPAPAVIGVVVLSLGAVAARGVRESVVTAGVMTLIETAGLLAIVAYGAPELATLPLRIGELVPADLASWQGVSAATILCFYAFLGFEDMVNLAEEVQDVRRVLPGAILITLAATTVLYALVTAVAVLAVAPGELAAAEAPLTLVFERCGGPPLVLGAIAAIALLNGALIQVVKASRVLYGLSREGWLPRAIGRVHPATRTPLVATALSTLGVASLALAFPLAGLAETTATITLITFAMANFALILIKRRNVPAAGGVSVPMWVPWAGLGVSLAFLTIEVIHRMGAT
jgi:amino acid transporter